MAILEFWANVYPVTPRYHYVGSLCGSRVRANEAAIDRKSALPGELKASGVGYRLRIRLKPEGAPRRYSSERNRQQWETMPEEMRKCPF